MSAYFDFVRTNARFLGFGFVLTLGSCFGQTFFVSLFGTDIRRTFDLSDGAFGLGYSLATLASGIVLIWLGKRVDDVPLPRYCSWVCVGLALACAVMALTPYAAILFLGFFGLRLTGQGLMTHTSVTSMARYFGRDRGKAISVASLGFPIGEALLPIVTVAAIATIGWRETWGVVSILLMIAFLPAMLWLLRGHDKRRPAETEGGDGADGGRKHRQWTRGEVMRDVRFYLIVLGVIASPAILTGTIFHQARLAEEKGWDLALLAAGFGGFAIAKIVTTILTGPLVDRFGATRIIPWTLPPLTLALATIGFSDATLAAFIYLVFAGINVGAQVATTGAMWAELYGVRHVGAIRALVTAVMMFSTALAPVGMGVLVDLKVSIATIALGCAVYTLAAIALLWIAPRLRIRVGET